MKAFCVTALATLLLVSFGSEPIGGAKILALYNLASPSHHIFHRVLLRALAARGHQVVVASPNVDREPFPNLTYFEMEGLYESLKEAYDYESFIKMSTIEFMSVIFDWASFTCEKELQSNGARELFNYNSPEKFDLILIDAMWNECIYGFIHKFGNPPVIAVAPLGIPPWTSIYIGTPENPSYIPSFLLPYSSHMSLFQRIHNFLVHHTIIFLHVYRHIPTQEAIARKYFKEDLPPFRDTVGNFSLLFANTVFGLEDARPISPNVIPIGGMHIKMTPDPLPKDLKAFLDSAKDGFIYFSLGSNLQSDAIPEERRRALLEAFSELPQKILWKFESDNFAGLPPNVKIGKWLPQTDILAHPNIRLFMSHCGKMSTSEATYRGVPIVGIPFFMDQILNLELLMSKGVAVKLDYLTITKESVLKALREILNNDSYQKNMKKLSEIYRDQPAAALDRAIFWTEYVIRHGGAPHLRPASTDLYWYQYLLLDVILVLLVAVLAVILLLYVLIKTMYRRTLNRKLSVKKKTN